MTLTGLRITKVNPPQPVAGSSTLKRVRVEFTAAGIQFDYKASWA